MPACYCTSFSCNGQLVDDKTRKRHKRFDDSQTYHKQTEVFHHFDFTHYPCKSYLQHDTNKKDLPNLQDTIPKTSTPIGALAVTHEVVSREKHTLCNQASIAKTLGSLVELERRAATGINTIQDLKNRISNLSPTKSLIDEIKTHRTEMEKMLASLTALWCHHNSVTTHAKEDLELQLQKGIKDLKQLKSVLTSKPAGPSACRVIKIEKPSEDLNHEHTMHCADIKNR